MGAEDRTDRPARRREEMRCDILSQRDVVGNKVRGPQRLGLVTLDQRTQGANFAPSQPFHLSLVGQFASPAPSNTVTYSTNETPKRLRSILTCSESAQPGGQDGRHILK